MITPSTPLPPLEPDPEFQVLRYPLSFSSIRSYLACPWCWSRRYVEWLPRVVTPGLALGSGIHAALAEARRQRQKGEVEHLETAVEAGVNAFDGAIAGLDRDGAEPRHEPILKLAPGETVESARRTLVTMCRQAVPTILEAEKPYGVLEIEAQIDFRGVFPFPFTAYADVWLDDQTWQTWGVIKDTKTVRDRRAPDEWAAWQLAIYGLPMWLAGDPVTLGVDQIVKGTRPEVRLWTQPGLHLQPTSDQYRALRDLVIDTARCIARDLQTGIFRPRPNVFGCDYEHPTPKFST